MSDRGGSPRPDIVLHVINSLGVSGGAEQQLISNITHFNDPQFEHHIAYIFESEFENRERAATDVAASVQPLLPSGSKRSRLRTIRELDHVVLDLEPSIIHCCLADASLAARVVGWRRRIPVVESLVNIAHDPVRLVDSPQVKAWKLGAHRLMDRVTMRRVETFHALSGVVAESWHDSVGISFDRIQVIPRGVDVAELDAHAARGPTREKLALEMDFDPDASILLSVGRQEPQKGQRYLIEALPKILEAEPSSMLLIAGRPGNASSNLHDISARLGVTSAVRFMGRRTDVAALVKAADIFVFPSLHEGLGVSLLEALALGAAVATSNERPMSDVVEDGSTGRLFRPRDPDDIASVVVELLADSEQRQWLGQAGRHMVADQYTSDAAARALEQLYRSTLGSAK